MKKHRKFSSGDWQLLSAYLDNQLSEKEKHQVDEWLQSDSECRQMLDLLQQTSKLLRSLPVRRVPRNFTLTTQIQPKFALPSFAGMLRYTSAMAAVLLVAVFVLDMTRKGGPVSAKAVLESQVDAVMMESAKASPEEAPMIITWGAPGPVMGAYGKGGGGAEGYGMGGGAPAYGIGGGAAEQAVIPNEFPLEAEIPEAEAAPLEEPTAPEAAESLMVPSNEPQSAAALPPEPLTGSGPILGIRTSAEKVTEPSQGQVSEKQPQPSSALPFTAAKIILAIIFVLTAIPAWFIKRK